ncbi:hypothetical protein GWR56_05535 [Mucilaginibacter sp. 14171R-50]|uniref:TlpA family protein disulfide reductase n=1 Tax=Mucilaginibacter sp. 14171R-50 TaxID=2703789 RepID=UPI00138BBFF0|nr:thioredoxin-like domain-containing protein [Mucilaginibacter sp. 14171R-50]QHS55025.1 hypothetical protein GWR56_05535 [Mucilaginibacter sp. 14171R-50]
MKYNLYLITLCFLIVACNNTPKFEVTIKSHVTNGSIILSKGKEQLLTQPLTNGSATITTPVESPRYYTLSIIDSDKPLSAKNNFEVYLENGKYIIDAKANTKGVYPEITSTSKTQQQLSDYYKTENEIAGGLNHSIDSMLVVIDSHAAREQSKKERSALFKKTRDLQTQRRKLEPKILDAYISRHPDNVVAPHIMSLQYMDEYPVEYNKLLSKLPDDAKKTSDGQSVADKLSVLVKLLPGSEAPDIIGEMPDGKEFTRLPFKGKLTLVEFWISGNRLCQLNHAKIAKGLIITDSDKKHFAVVSVSIDAYPQVWKRAVKQNNLTWPQVADFKGNNSPNVANWKITNVPRYFLVDGNWRIIKPNIDILDVDQEVHDYLAAHK